MFKKTKKTKKQEECFFKVSITNSIYTYKQFQKVKNEKN